MPLLTTNQGLSYPAAPPVLQFQSQAVTVGAKTLPRFTKANVCNGSVGDDLFGDDAAEEDEGTLRCMKMFYHRQGL